MNAREAAWSVALSPASEFTPWSAGRHRRGWVGGADQHRWSGLEKRSLITTESRNNTFHDRQVQNHAIFGHWSGLASRRQAAALSLENGLVWNCLLGEEPSLRILRLGRS